MLQAICKLYLLRQRHVTFKRNHRASQSLAIIDSLNKDMASTASPTWQQIKAALDEHGFFCLPEKEIGSRYAEFESKEFPCKTIEGLDFCKINTLDDLVSKVYPSALRFG